jgi:hypothetical protein
MQEHPIPQDVTGYKFHIVGNMTLKQFAQVGAGVLLAVIIYNTNLLVFIKWPMIVLSVGLGAMMAFVPIEERPLDHWIITFFKRLYSPTKFYWRKETTLPFAMQPKKTTIAPAEETFEVDLTPARTERIRQYIASVKQPEAVEPWESEENSRVAQILDTFGEVEVKDVESTPQKIRPSLNPRVRKLAPNQGAPLRQEMVFQNQTPVVEQPAEQFPKQPQPISDNQVIEKKLPVEVFADDGSADDLVEDKKIAQPQKKVSTNAALPFPQKELAPNKIVGMVLTKDNKLIDRAVVTIKDTNGRVAGAFNTNVLGQFSVSTPFPNGTYLVSVEKAGHQFPQETLTLHGETVEPLELRAV